jgi:uncharacterized protein (DUF2164 family)
MLGSMMMKILNRKQLGAFVELLQDYLSEEFELDIGELDAEMFANFIQEKLGPTIYNHALDDARTHLATRMDQLAESLIELEKIK